MSSGIQVKLWVFFKVYFVYIGGSLGSGMVVMGTFSAAASAMSVLEVQDLHHEVGLDVRIIFMYIMSI